MFAKWGLIVSVALASLATMSAKPSPYAFSAKDENGQTHTLEKYKGRYLVLEWTNSKCPFVVDHYERNTMVKLHNKFKNRNVKWLAVNSSHFNKPAD